MKFSNIQSSVQMSTVRGGNVKFDTTALTICSRLLRCLIIHIINKFSLLLFIKVHHWTFLRPLLER